MNYISNFIHEIAIQLINLYGLLTSIDWILVGITLNAIGSILVLGTGIESIREIFKKHHLKCNNIMDIRFQLSFHELTHDSPHLDLAKKLINKTTWEKIEENDELHQHVLWDNEDFITSIPSKEVLPEDWPNHSSEQEKVNILEELERKNISVKERSGDVNYCYNRGFTRIYQIESDKELGGEYLRVSYIPRVPEDFTGEIHDLPVIRIKICSFDEFVSETEEFIDAIILRTGGYFLAIGFILQLIIRI